MEETSGECSLDEGREFGFGDYRWHARYIYHATGSRVAFFNVPISLLFVAMLVLSSMQWFLQCRAILPAMQRVEVGGGLLVPAFQPERKFYSLYYDAASSHLEVLHSLQQETTNQVSMSVVRGKYQTSNVSGDLAQIDLRNVKGPWELQILARGMWGHVREYLVQLLPVSTVLRSVVLRSKYRHRGWTACVRRSAVGETSFISGAPLTFDIEVATEEFVFSRPEEPGGRGSGGGDIYMRFSASNGSAMSCTERCLYRSSCRSAWDGVGGCFFGMVPEGVSLCGLHEQRSAADVLAASASPYRDFLRSRAARTSVRMCFQDEQGGGPCTVVQSNGLGKTVIPNIRVSPSGSMLEVEVVRSNKAGRLVSVASQAFQVRYGAARVLKVLAFAKGVRMDVAVDGEGPRGWQRVSLRIRGMDFSALSDPFPITIVPLLDDHHFHVVPGAKQRGIDRESSSFRLADDCVEHPELHRFTVCGGTQRIGVVTVRVPKWEPLQHQFRLYVQRGSGPALEAGDWSRGVWVHINSPPTYAFPAEMAVERQCSVVFKEPPEIASRWLSPGVFQHGLESCGGKNITFEASGVSVLSPWRFFLMGITMYSGQLARFLHLALQSAARSDDGSRFEHKFDKLAEITPNKFGVDIKIPARVPQEFAVWVPWKSPQPLTWNLNVDELLWSRLAKAAYFVCVRSKITRRTALRLLLGMAHGEIRMYGTLARCIQKKRITLGVPLEHQSPEFQAVRLRQPDVLEALARTRLLADAVGTVVTRGREVFYAARAVEDLVVAHGISALGTRRTLNLTAMGLTEREVPGIVDLIYKADVRRLDISWNRLGLRGIERLLGRLHELAKTRLTIVRVGHNVNASDEAKKQRTSRYQFLAGLHGLQELDLSCSGVGASSATELEPLLAAMPGLKILNLSSNNLGDEGLTVLAATLGSLRALRSLDISCNNVSSAGLRALNATALGSLEALHISGNLLGEENCNDLANALAHMALLRHLSVGSNGIGVAGAASIGHILGSLVALQTFDVSQNPITEMGLIALRLARLPKLLALDLSGTALGEPSAATLAATLHALPNLKTLRLDSNGLGAGGVVAVVRALPGRLTGLSLGDNSIGASSGGNSIGVSASGKTISVSGNSLGAGEALAQALRNLTQLRHVDVRHNDLRTADLRPVCLVLESIASLRTLRIQDNDFSSDASDLWRCLAGLRRVRHLDISGNHIFSSAGPLLRDGMKTALAGMWRLETLVIHGNRLPRQVLTDVMDHMVHLIDEQAINLKLMQVRGVVPVPGDLLTEGDLLMLRGIYTWILLA